ncbi:MAG: hypothetical protein KJO50_07470 [Bacteroidia bacterium]|nr:hypothetical protein [Bacteroidia bacterium]MBT8230083.1 hypothetical protein [Bacteroidia bacterium]NNK90583.1 hypothetical protein [Saprospiraceae bacterium]
MIFLSDISKRLILGFVLYISFLNILVAQTYLTGVSTKWDDAFFEWQVYAFENEEETEGELRLKWPFKNDWTEWVLDIEDQYFTIRLRYRNVLDHWEIRGGDVLVEMKPIWLNDYTQWRISYNSERIKWKTQYPNDLNYWFYEDDANGFAEFYTIYRNDPRDWEFNDQTENIPFEVKLAMAFISIYYSTPKS